MSSLGELYFALGLDDKKFNDAIDKAKKRVAELTGEVTITVQVDADKVKQEVQDAVKKIDGKEAEVKVGVDIDFAKIENLKARLKESKQQAESLENALKKASSDAEKTRIKHEYSVAWNRAYEIESRLSQYGVVSDDTLKSYRINLKLAKEELEEYLSEYDKFLAKISQKKRLSNDEKSQKTTYENDIEDVKERITSYGNLIKKVEEYRAAVAKQTAAATEAKAAVNNVAQSTQTIQHVVDEKDIATVKALEESLRKLNEQLELRNRLQEGQQRYNAEQKAEKEQLRKEKSQVQETTKEVERLSKAWMDVAKVKRDQANAKEQESFNQKAAYSKDWMDMARAEKAAEASAAKQRSENAKASNKALQAQLAQLFRLEEAIAKLQRQKVKLDTSGIDKDSENYRKAAAALDAYIDKLQQLQGSGKALNKRSVSSALGSSMKAVIDDSNLAIKEQKALEKALAKELASEKGSSVVINTKTTAMKKFQKAIIGTTNWASQLNNQLGNAFSIYAIERFIRSLYTVGGEFQKQQIALQNMIGDTAKADVIFDRMKDLAVTSPFTFSELASYTKQMSAYGIEYEELYDTTKRLADISAGVGVDMGRLILAYGQVRSAEVLRGQELRQFTEAGIPLVAELAKRLEEVRGKSVAVGEVFDAISKREISFGMVKDVLFDMTDPGGRFFETQEKLAESLAGKWSNLKDAWDIMIADIANGNNTVLKNLADVTAWLVKNWEAWLPLVSGVTAALGTYRTVMTVVIPLQQAFNILTKANPWIAIASGVIGAAAAIYGYATDTKTATDELKGLNHELDKNIQKNKEKEQTANRYLDSLKAQNTSEEQRIRLLEELKSLYPDIFKDMKMEQVLLADTIELKKRMSEVTKAKTLSDYDDLLTTAEKNRIELRKKYDDTYIQTGATGKRNRWYDQLEDVKASIREYKEERSALEKELDWKGKVNALNDTSTLEDYINLYGEVGKAIKVLRDNGINDETLVKPEQGIPLDEYYDKLKSALQKQEDIKTKFSSDTSIYKNADKAAGVYKLAIEAIKGIWQTNKGDNKGGKSPAEEAAERDAKAYLDTLKARMSELASKWDLYKDLFEATGNKSLSMNIAFDGVIPNFDNYISHLKGLMQEEIQKRGLGISVADLLSEGKEGIAKRVNDKSQPAWTEDVAKNLNAIIDSYNNANKKLREESVRNFIEILNNSKDFAQQIADIDRKLQQDLSDLAEMSGGTDSELYKKHSAELIKKAEEEKTKVNFEEFKKSSDWVKVFDDLDRVSDATLDNMISKIEEFARQAHLSEEVTKQLVEAMGKLRDESIERNPLEGFKDAWNRRNYYRSLQGKIGEYDEHGKLITQQMVDDGLAEANEDLKDSALAVADKFQAVANAAELLSPLFEGLGFNVEGLIDSLNGIVSGAQTGSSIASAFGATGPWGAIIGAGVAMLSAAFSSRDKALQRQIEESQHREKVLESLSNNLKSALDRTMGGLYTFSLDEDAKKDMEKIVSAYFYEDYLGNKVKTKTKKYSEATRQKAQEALDEDSYFDAQWASLLAQKEEIEYQLKKEQNKNKDKSEEDIENYKQSIKDINAEIEDLAKDIANELYDVDFSGWANQLAEALVNAWANGEDAAQAYKDTVDDILRDVGVSVISQQLIQERLKPLMDEFITQFTEDNGQLTDASMEILAGMYDEAEYAAKATEAYLEGLKKMGIDVSDVAEESSEGLSKGVQSVTEDTADLLASYVNGMRADLSVNRSLFEKLVGEDVPKMSYLAEAQLRELSAIQANTAKNVALVGEIRDLVNRVVDKGSNKLKV